MLLFVVFVVDSRALTIYKDCLGPHHDDVGSALNLLAVVVGEQGRYLEVCSCVFFVVCVCFVVVMIVCTAICFLAFDISLCVKPGGKNRWQANNKKADRRFVLKR